MLKIDQLQPAKHYPRSTVHRRTIASETQAESPMQNNTHNSSILPYASPIDKSFANAPLIQSQAKVNEAEREV